MVVYIPSPKHEHKLTLEYTIGMTMDYILNTILRNKYVYYRHLASCPSPVNTMKFQRVQWPSLYIPDYNSTVHNSVQLHPSLFSPRVRSTIRFLLLNRSNSSNTISSNMIAFFITGNHGQRMRHTNPQSKARQNERTDRSPEYVQSSQRHFPI
jgi:hypothetical protein